MFIRVGYDIVLDFPAPTTMTLLLHVLPEFEQYLRAPERLVVEPIVPVSEFIDSFGNHCARLVAPAGKFRMHNDTVIEHSGGTEPEFPDAKQHSVDELPTECLQFLLPSRYCEVDRFNQIGEELFGKTAPGWARVSAIRDWVHSNVEFGYQYASNTKTAWDVFHDRKGVCRDFTHLAITLCRVMGIPARYATGYLGDIGIPPVDCPMDFSACFQVYLGGRWHTWDARHPIRRIGWILMATGRDATDCAITTTFGLHTLEKFQVWADEVPTPELTVAKV
ncbi:MAG: transglutaminase family protein [Candidatus Obscuribacterales bacterium]|jgi:transglutaminase-like putative cysteine protease|nr:transglutaminase family protein [Candidatus Obscuribacterales bacterium]